MSVRFIADHSWLKLDWEMQKMPLYKNILTVAMYVLVAGHSGTLKVGGQ